MNSRESYDPSLVQFSSRCEKEDDENGGTSSVQSSDDSSIEAKCDKDLEESEEKQREYTIRSSKKSSGAGSPTLRKTFTKATPKCLKSSSRVLKEIKFMSGF